MPTPELSDIVLFGPFKLDLKAGELQKHGRSIRLQEQPFQILKILLEHSGQVVAREELRKRLWPDDTNVEFGHSINSAINRLRDVLGDTPEKPKYVETVARRGYRLVLPVERELIGSPIPTVPVAEAHMESAISSTAVPFNSQVSPPEPTETSRNKKARKVAGLVALCALAAGLTLESQRRHWLQPPLRRITSLAVLPLENVSIGKAPDYFADGMTDELITELGKISALRVISRTSVMRYQGAQKPVAEIARDLHVDGVIEGTVLRSGNRVRVTAHLIQAVPEAHVWTDQYERDLGDVMALQDDLARQIAKQIKVKLTPQEQSRFANARPVSARAHEAYLKGRYLFNRRTDQALEKSIALLQQAIDADPRYALAYAGLAESYCALVGYAELRPGEAFPNAEKAATKALEIDDTLAEAHTALGFVQSCYHRNWQAAEREFRRAMDLNPNYATAHLWYGEHLRNLGQAELEIAEFKRARELDPLSLAVNAGLGRGLSDGRHFDEAIEQCRKTLELEPNFAQAHWCLGLGYLGKARYDDAILKLQRAKALGMAPVALCWLSYAYEVAGKKTEARKVLREYMKLSRNGQVSPYFMARIYAGLGEKNQAFEWLDRAYKEGDWMRLMLDPFFDRLRSDPRFHELLRRLNLPP
jgi:TolB-like protein/DNA-binding winged helix-turn-helix (wHTH) protein/Tfp pilus assembly protein PilF